jgi:hypothetical protein
MKGLMNISSMRSPNKENLKLLTGPFMLKLKK